jgi:hypothetical protein
MDVGADSRRSLNFFNERNRASVLAFGMPWFADRLDNGCGDDNRGEFLGTVLHKQDSDGERDSNVATSRRGMGQDGWGGIGSGRGRYEWRSKVYGQPERQIGADADNQLCKATIRPSSFSRRAGMTEPSCISMACSLPRYGSLPGLSSLAIGRGIINRRVSGLRESGNRGRCRMAETDHYVFGFVLLYVLWTLLQMLARRGK